jgi:hypothetical protein
MTIVIFVKEEVVLSMEVVLQQICMLKEYMEVEREFIDTSLENLKLGNIIEKPDGNKTPDLSVFFRKACQFRPSDPPVSLRQVVKGVSTHLNLSQS